MCASCALLNDVRAIFRQLSKSHFNSIKIHPPDSRKRSKKINLYAFDKCFIRKLDLKQLKPWLRKTRKCVKNCANLSHASTSFTVCKFQFSVSFQKMLYRRFRRFNAQLIFPRQKRGNYRQKLPEHPVDDYNLSFSLVKPEWPASHPSLLYNLTSQRPQMLR